MKIYKKVHTDKTALKVHAEKIDKRGGSYQITGNTISYAFPSEDEKELPADTQQQVDLSKVTYRGSTYGTLIKVHGKEYLISSAKFNELGGIKKIRFSAPTRK